MASCNSHRPMFVKLVAIQHASKCRMHSSARAFQISVVELDYHRLGLSLACAILIVILAEHIKVTDHVSINLLGLSTHDRHELKMACQSSFNTSTLQVIFTLLADLTVTLAMLPLTG